MIIYFVIQDLDDFKALIECGLSSCLISYAVVGGRERLLDSLYEIDKSSEIGEFDVKGDESWQRSEEKIY